MNLQIPRPILPKSDPTSTPPPPGGPRQFKRTCVSIACVPCLKRKSKVSTPRSVAFLVIASKISNGTWICLHHRSPVRIQRLGAFLESWPAFKGGSNRGTYAPPVDHHKGVLSS